MVLPPVLMLPQEGLPFILDTYASGCSVGAVLSQLVEGQERVVAYYSKSLTKPERNYCVTRRELLAVVQAVRHFRVYLGGRHFELRTDHSSLQWLMSFKEPEGQMCRWLQLLQDYHFEVHHRSGKSHGNADALSRRPCEANNCRHCDRLEKQPTMEVRAVGVTPEIDLKEAQNGDVDICSL